MTVADGPVFAGEGRAFVDLHCHSSASFDSLSSPRSIVRVAAERGLTHLAITDHERLDGAFRARDAAPEGLTVIVGEEIRTREGDIIGLFLERLVPPGLSARETIAAIHEQGGLAGAPHPFDRFRGSALRARRGAGRRRESVEEFASELDYVEAFNARVPYPAANQHAFDFAAARALPGVASSDAHTLMEVGIAYTVLAGPIRNAAELRAALRETRLVTGRASLFVRGLTPVNRLVQRFRGNVRIRGITPTDDRAAPAATAPADPDRSPESARSVDSTRS